jgi:HD superfamily phosphohydrolase
MKNKSGIFTIITLIILIVGFRLYTKYNRDQHRKEQQQKNTEFYLQHKKLEQERVLTQQDKAIFRRLDSIDSLKRESMANKMKKIKEIQKRLQKEIDAKK